MNTLQEKIKEEEKKNSQLFKDLMMIRSQKKSMEIQILNEKEKSEMYKNMSQQNFDEFKNNAMIINEIELKERKFKIDKDDKRFSLNPHKLS